MGWPAPPAPGSLSRRRSSPRERTAKPGGVKLYTEAEVLGIERDRRLDVINYVTHTDRGHLWSPQRSSCCCVLCTWTWWHGEGLGTSCESTVFWPVRSYGFLRLRPMGSRQGLHTRGSGNLVDSRPVIANSWEGDRLRP